MAVSAAVAAVAAAAYLALPPSLPVAVCWPPLSLHYGFFRRRRLRDAFNLFLRPSVRPFVSHFIFQAYSEMKSCSPFHLYRTEVKGTSRKRQSSAHRRHRATRRRASGKDTYQIDLYQH